ncbi:MAG: YdcF family protein, partial [Hyphomicrobium sp.]
FSEGQPAAVDRSARGIIILGGFEDGWVTAGRGGLALNEAAERLTEGLRLARQLPEARVVFTGGVGQLMASADAADAVDTYLTQAGIAPTRIVIENKSRTTFENAVLTRAFIDPKPGERWLLVTSAFHMPRAVGAFRSAGFDILPFPVDFRTRDWGDVFVPYSSVPDGLKRADVAAKEWAGLFAYWLTGRSSSIFPGP